MQIHALSYWLIIIKANVIRWVAIIVILLLVISYILIMLRFVKFWLFVASCNVDIVFNNFKLPNVVYILVTRIYFIYVQKLYETRVKWRIHQHYLIIFVYLVHCLHICTLHFEFITSFLLKIDVSSRRKIQRCHWIYKNAF